MTRRIIIGASIALALGAASVAGAHPDPNPDQTKCDTWWRDGHGTGSGNHNYPSHHHTHGSDMVLNDPAHTVIHAHSGHYVVRNDFGYVEVVGGGSYRGPDPEGNDLPGQGGYVQGEIDPAAGAPDGDFNVAYFGPNADELPAANPAAIQSWVEAQYGSLCLDVAGQHVQQESREP